MLQGAARSEPRSQTSTDGYSIRILCSYINITVACELADSMLSFINISLHPFAFIFQKQSVFPLKRLSLHPQWLSLSPYDWSVWSMFLGVVCVCTPGERMCASMHMLMCAIEAGRATTNAVWQRSVWASSLDSPSTWTPFTPDACGPCMCPWRKATTFASKYTQKCTHTDVTQLSCGRHGIWD